MRKKRHPTRVPNKVTFLLLTPPAMPAKISPNDNVNPNTVDPTWTDANATDAATIATDFTNPIADGIAGPLVHTADPPIPRTAEAKERVDVSKTSTTGERSDASLG